MSDRPTIALIRETNLLTDDQVSEIAAALQIQGNRDFERAWGLGTEVIFVPPRHIIPAGSQQIILLDHCDLADAFGYHKDVGPGGEPCSIIGVRDDIDAGASPAATVGHEAWEMRADAMLNRTVRVTQSDGRVLEYAVEVCDACEGDQFAYKINGVLMTAFVTPAWFDPHGKPPFTFPVIPSISAPFMLAEGGYIGVHEVEPALLPWQQRLARGKPGRHAMNKHPRSRTMRRFNKT